jgi:hypothetical protein
MWIIKKCQIYSNAYKYLNNNRRAFNTSDSSRFSSLGLQKYIVLIQRNRSFISINLRVYIHGDERPVMYHIIT